jgi:hypothetical protein
MKRFVHALSIALITTVGFSCPWLPDPPTPASPADGSVGVSTEPILQWNVASSATSYRLQVSTDRVFSSIAVDDSTLTATSNRLSGLSNGTSYYWRVLATNSYGESDWSTVSLFTTIVAPPDRPKLSAPVNESSGISTDPMLCWDPSNRATSYRLQVSADSSFATIIFDKKEITGTFYPDSGLAVGTRYYWRVRASNTGGTSDWSRVWSFIVGGL